MLESFIKQCHKDVEHFKNHFEFLYDTDNASLLIQPFRDGLLIEVNMTPEYFEECLAKPEFIFKIYGHTINLKQLINQGTHFTSRKVLRIKNEVVRRVTIMMVNNEYNGVPEHGLKEIFVPVHYDKCAIPFNWEFPAHITCQGCIVVDAEEF